MEAQTTLSRERSADEYRQSIEANLDTAQQIRRLVESLLELARLEATHDQERHTDFDLSEVARTCVEQVSPLAATHRVEVHCDTQTCIVHGDEEQIWRVITSLLSNAIQYNHEGGEVWIRARPVEGEARLSVTNTGPGIAAKDIPLVFDRFYRADKARSRAEGHSGLGLAISRAIVESHGGVISAQSDSRQGLTTVEVRLPVKGNN